MEAQWIGEQKFEQKFCLRSEAFLNWMRGEVGSRH